MSKAIKITCKGSNELPLEQLQYFQGNLKTLEQPQFDKLKRSILKHGFSFPVFVWNDQILDGHQRVFVTRHLIEQEGFAIDGAIPVVEIQAKDRKEAGEKLLALNSQFAKITDEGLYGFLHDFNIDIAGLADDLELPDIDMDKFITGYVGDDIEASEMPEMSNDEKAPIQQMTFTLHDEQVEVVKEALQKAKDAGPFEETGNENSNGNALTRIAEAYRG